MENPFANLLKVRVTNPLSFLTNYAIGAGSGKVEPSITNVMETAAAGQQTVADTTIATGSAIKDAGETVVNTVTGGIETIKKYLPAVAVGGVALLLLSRKR